MNRVELILLFIGFYLIGSINFSILFGFIFLKVDIRKIGSLNGGATNLKRAGGQSLFLWAGALDALKGALPLLICKKTLRDVDPNGPLFLLLFSALILGHLYPIWFKFKGGKGVATAAGGASALSPQLIPIAILLYLLSLKKTKTSGKASLIVSLSLWLNYYISSLIFKITPHKLTMLFYGCLGVLIALKHIKNIKEWFSYSSSSG